MSARVLLATECHVLRDGLTSLLERQEGIQSVTPAADAEAAMRALESGAVDIAVLDVSLHGPGADVTLVRPRGRRTPLPWIALTGSLSRTSIEEIMRSGAAGIVSSWSSARALAECIRRVHAGASYVAVEVMDAMARVPLNRSADSGSGANALTSREIEVLRLIASDYSSPEIASRLGLSPRTVETHRSSLMSKLELRKTAALVRYAVREGLVTA
ncbi:MAG: response regulator transcription factor [Myxococcota bacterium]